VGVVWVRLLKFCLVQAKMPQNALVGFPIADYLENANYHRVVGFLQNTHRE
jgi:hypothetical protein